MAKCDQGYLCSVCGREVTSIVESDLYLRYVIGQLDPERLHLEPERHLRCNPLLSQYIIDERCPSVIVEGPFAMTNLDPRFVAQQQDLVTRGYRRLWEIVESPNRNVTDYPLPEVSAKYQT